MRWNRRAYNVIASCRGWTEFLLFLVAVAALEIADQPDSMLRPAVIWIGLLAIVGAIIKFGFDAAIWFGLLPKHLDDGSWTDL